MLKYQTLYDGAYVEAGDEKAAHKHTRTQWERDKVRPAAQRIPYRKYSQGYILFVCVQQAHAHPVGTRYGSSLLSLQVLEGP